MIMSLMACNNYGLMGQLETPGYYKSNSGSNFGPMYLFAANNPVNGDLTFGNAFPTARQGADAQCQTTRAGITFPNNGCNLVRAVISLTASDSIASMPVNYGIPTNRGINAPNNFTIAPNWNVLRDGTSGNSLAPNVMPAATTWWSFSDTGGAFASNNCGGGTNNTSSNGATADSSVTGANWIAGAPGTELVCSSNLKLLCICY